MKRVRQHDDIVRSCTGNNICSSLTGKGRGNGARGLATSNALKVREDDCLERMVLRISLYLLRIDNCLTEQEESPVLLCRILPRQEHGPVSRVRDQIA